MNDKKKEKDSKSYLLYAGLAAAGAYSIYKISFLRKMVMPAIIAAATKYAGDCLVVDKTAAKA